MQTIEALRDNYLADRSDLYIFSDAPKNVNAKVAVESVRAYIRNVTGFKSVTIIERPENYGLARSIITGVTEIMDRFGKVIVLEDDLLTATNFIEFMNQSLNKYEDNQKVWSISGFSFNLRYRDDYSFDGVFGIRASSWGWATWRDRWNKVDWQVADYQEFKSNTKSQRVFNKGGSDLSGMLNDQMNGRINSWAIRFCYAQFKNNGYDFFPVKSKVKSIGFGGDATNTRGMGSRFETTLDESAKRRFLFPDRAIVEPYILRQFRKRFSIITRIKYKILKMFLKHH